MLNLVCLMVSDKNIFKDFLSSVVMATRVFEESNSFKKSEEDVGRNISVKFHKNRISSCREDV